MTSNEEIIQKSYKSMEEEEDEFADLGDKVKARATEQRTPKCCGCCNMMLASISLGLFYVVPIYFYFIFWETLYFTFKWGAYVVGIPILICGITSLVCLYNAVSPQVWICELISTLQKVLSIAFFAISFPTLILAFVQTFIYTQDNLEELFDNTIQQFEKKLEDGSLLKRFVSNAENKENTAGSILFILGIAPISFACIGLAISYDFTHMASFVFNLKLMEEYKALKEWDKKLEEDERNAEKEERRAAKRAQKLDAIDADLQVSMKIDHLRGEHSTDDVDWKDMSHPESAESDDDED